MKWHFKRNTPIDFIKNMYGGRVRFWGGEDTTTTTQTQTPVFTAAPEFPEASGARSTWWNTLQADQKSGSYGANLPNYENIFNNAKNRINQYYWGGPSGGGLIDKIKAGAARRGVSESPAIDVLSQRMGAEQAGQLGDISTNLDVTKANAIENARTNWMNSLMNLSGQKPAGAWGGTTTTTTPQQSAWPDLIGAGVGLGSRYLTNNTLSSARDKQNQWMSNVYGGMPNQTQSSLTDRGVTNSFTDFGKTALDIGKYLPGPQQPFVAGADMLADWFL